ncbi:MAG: NAD(P)H-binding protein [Anaerolineae bacterium]|nr:NAD(P)H-binding protein [Anaerolineae bacterium]
MKTILVLGATGFLGEPVARKLKADGFDVRIMARSIDKAREKFDDEFEIVSGDATNPTDIKAALEGCDGVHLTVSGDAELPAALNVAAAAPDSRLERITYISGCTAVEKNRWFPLIDDKLNAEAAIKSCGVDYTIFAPSWPMEMLIRYAMNGKPTLMGKQTNAFHFFALADLARMVSTAYQSDAAINKRFVVHGPEAIPFTAALVRYCAVFHPDAKKVSKLPVGLAKLMARLMKNDLMLFGAELSGYFDRVGELGDPTEADQVLGAPTITLDQWMEQRKQSLS